MEDQNQDGQESTKEVLYTKGGYECTTMIHPKTGEELVIRECFDRWQLEEDAETDEEYKMRKRLINAFKKKTKKRGVTKHVSRVYEPRMDSEGTAIGMNIVGNTYRNEKGD